VVLFGLESVLGLLAWMDRYVSRLLMLARKLEEVVEANFSSSISQTVVLLGGHKLDKRRVTIRIGIEKSVEV